MIGHAARIGALVLAVLTFGVPAHAGDGRIVGDKLDLSVLFTYPEGDPDSWKPLFDEASRLLYNATNGQLQLGRVRVAKCAYDKPGADVWVLDGNAGAFANVLGLGGEGHVYISQTHKSTSGGALGQFGLVHELGHYVFGMYDEYKGETTTGAVPAEQTTERAPNQFCTTDLDPVACLMDGGTTVAPNNARTEFCTHTSDGLSTAHNTGVDVGGLTFVNFQELLNGESCWETMARNAGFSPPSSVDTVDPAGLEPIVWENLDEGNRIVITIDRSGSMIQEIELAKEAARQLIDLLHARRTLTADDGSMVTLEGESLAIVSFARDVTVEFEMQEIIDESTRDAAKAALESMEADGGTDFVIALEAAYDEIESASVTPACSEAIVFLSDGIHRTDEDPRDALPALEDRGIQVYSVALGDEVDLEFMQEAAAETGGLFFFAEDATDLPGIFAEISAAVRSGGSLFHVDGEVTDEGRGMAILVDSFSEEVTAICTWDGPALDMTLTTPGGELIDVAAAGTRPDVEAIVREGFLYIRVLGPDAGDWTAFVRPTDPPPAPIPFDLTVLTEGSLVSVDASASAGVVDAPAPVELRVEVIAGVPVAGASVGAVVRRPGAPPAVIELFDDGDPAHGDRFAGDGVYQALFDDYTLSGVYTFDIRVVNENGTGPDPDLPFVEDGADPTPVPIPPFVRLVQTSAVVDDVAGWVFADLTSYPASLRPGATEELVCVIELVRGGAVEGIDVSTLRLNGHAAPLPGSAQLGDHDGDGIADLSVAFGADEIIGMVGVGMSRELEMTGMTASGGVFSATSTVDVIDATPGVSLPAQIVESGTEVTVSWLPLDRPDATYDGHLSLDGGLTWAPLFADLAGETSYAWTVDAPPSSDARILVEARTPERLFGQMIGDPFEIVSTTVTVPDVPAITAFLGAAPNPTVGTTVLSFALAEAGDVRLEVYDVAGRLVRRLVRRSLPAGTHEARWDGRDEAGSRAESGVYYFVFATGGYERTGRLLLVR